MTSCILYQSLDRSLTVVDIPRSIELAQGKRGKRLISEHPIQSPFPTHEPKTAQAKASLGTHSVEDLLTQKHLELALSSIKERYHGEWCLPRVVADDNSPEKSTPERMTKKRRRGPSDDEPPIKSQNVSMNQLSDIESRHSSNVLSENQSLLTNPHPHAISISLNQSNTARYILPPHSTALHGDIQATTPTFLHNAPKFDLITMDPPWPNRSARRKASYGISYNMKDISSLLYSIPAGDHLSDEGYVGMWVTNKASFRELVLELFVAWGVVLVEEWIWLKVTSGGEPICALDGLWRKPYEVFMLGRRGAGVEGVERRVLVAVPDLHSRKPNLKLLFDELMENRGKGETLEVFARNMTEGWWTWGNEVLKYQAEEYWLDVTQQET